VLNECVDSVYLSVRVSGNIWILQPGKSLEWESRCKTIDKHFKTLKKSKKMWTKPLKSREKALIWHQNPWKTQTLILNQWKSTVSQYVSTIIFNQNRTTYVNQWFEFDWKSVDFYWLFFGVHQFFSFYCLPNNFTARQESAKKSVKTYF